MDFIKINLRRMRRRNRIPSRLLAAVSSSLLVLVLTMSLLVLPASAKNGMRMPRTDSGIVTDGDGIISSDDGTGMLPDVGDKVTDKVESILPDNTTAPGTSGGDASSSTNTTTPGTTNNGTGDTAGDDAGSNMIAWIIGLTVLAGVVVAIVLVIRWASRKES